MRWGRKMLKGYWRHPTVGLPAIVREELVAEVATTERETLAPELERVTWLGARQFLGRAQMPKRPSGRIVMAGDLK
jgi:hypothetical protein